MGQQDAATSLTEFGRDLDSQQCSLDKAIDTVSRILTHSVKNSHRKGLGGMYMPKLTLACLKIHFEKFCKMRTREIP